VKYKLYTWNGWYKSLISHFKLKSNVRVVKYKLYTRNGWYKSLISHFKLKSNVRVVKYKIYTWNGWYKSLISHFKLKGNVWVVKYTLYTWNRWYKTNNVWKVYNGKIEVVFFVIESGRKLTIGVKFEVSVKTCGRVVSDLLSPILWRCILMESTSQVINWQDMINIPDCALSSEIFYIINVFFRCILKLQKCCHFQKRNLSKH
jgi:hypothetical protein